MDPFVQFQIKLIFFFNFTFGTNRYSSNAWIVRNKCSRSNERKKRRERMREIKKQKKRRKMYKFLGTEDDRRIQVKVNSDGCVISLVQNI